MNYLFGLRKPNIKTLFGDEFAFPASLKVNDPNWQGFFLIFLNFNFFKMNTTFVATATEKCFVKGGGNASADINGNFPVQFTVFAGTCPARALVISGTLAQALKIEAGNTYVLEATFRENNEYGDNFTITNLGKPELYELPKYKTNFGAARVVQTENGKIVNAEKVEADPNI